MVPFGGGSRFKSDKFTNSQHRPLKETRQNLPIATRREEVELPRWMSAPYFGGYSAAESLIVSRRTCSQPSALLILLRDAASGLCRSCNPAPTFAERFALIAR